MRRASRDVGSRVALQRTGGVSGRTCLHLVRAPREDGVALSRGRRPPVSVSFLRGARTTASLTRGPPRGWGDATTVSRFACSRRTQCLGRERRGHERTPARQPRTREAPCRRALRVDLVSFRPAGERTKQMADVARPRLACRAATNRRRLRSHPCPSRSRAARGRRRPLERWGEATTVSRFACSRRTQCLGRERRGHERTPARQPRTREAPCREHFASTSSASDRRERGRSRWRTSRDHGSRVALRRTGGVSGRTRVRLVRAPREDGVALSRGRAATRVRLVRAPREDGVARSRGRPPVSVSFVRGARTTASLTRGPPRGMERGHDRLTLRVLATDAVPGARTSRSRTNACTPAADARGALQKSTSRRPRQLPTGGREDEADGGRRATTARVSRCDEPAASPVAPVSVSFARRARTASPSRGEGRPPVSVSFARRARTASPSRAEVSVSFARRARTASPSREMGRGHDRLTLRVLATDAVPGPRTSRSRTNACTPAANARGALQKSISLRPRQLPRRRAGERSTSSASETTGERRRSRWRTSRDVGSRVALQRTGGVSGRTCVRLVRAPGRTRRASRDVGSRVALRRTGGVSGRTCVRLVRAPREDGVARSRGRPPVSVSFVRGARTTAPLTRGPPRGPGRGHDRVTLACSRRTQCLGRERRGHERTRITPRARRARARRARGRAPCGGACSRGASSGTCCRRARRRRRGST
jgi:hypothetical protein